MAEDHFVRHRWASDEPRVTLVAIPPATEPGGLRWLAGRYQEAIRIGGAELGMNPSGVSLIPPEWLHVTVHPLGFVSDVPEEAYARWRERVATAVGRGLHRPATFARAGTGRTGVSLPASVEHVFTHSAASAALAAEQFLGRYDQPNRNPHLGVGYFRAGADPGTLTRVLQAAAATGLGNPPAIWQVDRLTVVDMRQDIDVGYYTWTVRDEIPLPTQPRSATATPQA